MSENLRGHFYILIATILIAGSFKASAVLSQNHDSIILTLFRFIFALLVLLPFVIFRLKSTIKLIPYGIVVGFLYGLYFILMFEALKYTTVLNSGSIYTLVPLMTAIFCIFICNQKITLSLIAIYIIGIISTLIIVFRGDLNLLMQLSLNRGDIIFFIAALSMSLYPIAVRFLYKDGQLIPMATSTLIGGVLLMLLYLFITQKSIDVISFSSDEAVAMSYLVVATTIFTLFLYQRGIQILGPKKVMAYIYLNPAIVAIIIYTFDGIQISFITAIGIAISTIATIAILNRRC